MNGFVLGEFSVRGDRGLEVEQPSVGVEIVDDLERITPGSPRVNRLRDRPVGPFGQLYVSTGIADHGFAQCRVAGTVKDLIDTAAEHDVTAQQHRYCACVTDHETTRSPPSSP